MPPTLALCLKRTEPNFHAFYKYIIIIELPHCKLPVWHTVVLVLELQIWYISRELNCISHNAPDYASCSSKHSSGGSSIYKSEATHKNHVASVTELTYFLRFKQWVAFRVSLVCTSISAHASGRNRGILFGVFFHLPQQPPFQATSHVILESPLTPPPLFQSVFRGRGGGKPQQLHLALFLAHVEITF